MSLDLQMIRDLAAGLFFALGGLAVITGAIGLVRFPDFYTRMHAAGITDTAGAGLMILAMMIVAPNWQVVVKLAFIEAFLFFTSPVSTHAIAHAAWLVGQRPMLGPNLEREENRP